MVSWMGRLALQGIDEEEVILMNKKISVTQVDNRGTKAFPFGFVYLDSTRVGFSRGDGVWAASGWKSTDLHVLAAKQHLDQVMPGWNAEKEN